ncbi:hypothetical protein NDU88_002631 [Pleurodeles waltl]|uniref:Uncharacterized protein n=1 Tax=Pleurodeles waltl TaxID=8319 RepID=A0AAV7UWR4_PLEWA|nr:hypothetical protein NDU88_002631 [Pleurodeles waltl]
MLLETTVSRGGERSMGRSLDSDETLPEACVSRRESCERYRGAEHWCLSGGRSSQGKGGVGPGHPDEQQLEQGEECAISCAPWRGCTRRSGKPRGSFSEVRFSAAWACVTRDPNVGISR